MTNWTVWLPGLVVLAGLLWWGRQLTRIKRRAILKSQAMPASWLTILQERVALYQRLPEALKSELHGHMQVFIDEKAFFMAVKV